ncbi:MarR family transcriptional regulator [uncultured Thomasclavelia sp.]|uniref:MarR family transcriptional regulator n=1 Tax=uncultured Thomasclavelia sp. TaxID=3025759 RepID=UPI00280AD2B2|nr:MarR family transcriptional regulator [uncultured Thomasclavelia sp.]
MDRKLLEQLITVVDEGFDIMQEYANKPRQFNGIMLYPVETQTLEIIGQNPGITASKIAKELKKTLSASSQILKKLEQKELVSRIKNPHNNREYNLYLTDVSKSIIDLHSELDEMIYSRYQEDLKDLSNEEILNFIKVQKVLNKEFLRDLEESF